MLRVRQRGGVARGMQMSPSRRPANVMRDLEAAPRRARPRYGSVRSLVVCTAGSAERAGPGSHLADLPVCPRPRPRHRPPRLRRRRERAPGGTSGSCGPVNMPCDGDTRVQGEVRDARGPAAEPSDQEGVKMTGSTVRAALSAGVKYQQHVNFCSSIFSNSSRVAFTVSARPCFASNLLPVVRNFSSQAVTKNLHLMTPEDDKPKVDKKSLTVETRSERPLVVLLEWMAAHRNHVKKFTDLYLGSGYDVLVAPLRPSQLLFPTSGSQVVAEDVIRFLAQNPAYKQVVVHGFSVGGYMWGEVCLKMKRHPGLPQQVVATVWDSLVDVVGAANGAAAAMFPKNNVMKRVAYSMIQLHLWMFKDIATKHYYKSSDCFHDPPVKSPALVFASRGDPICTLKEMMEVVDCWESQNTKVTVKIWDDSPHVGHLRLHRKEYLSELNNFLKSLDLPEVRDTEADKIASKL